MYTGCSLHTVKSIHGGEIHTVGPRRGRWDHGGDIHMMEKTYGKYASSHWVNHNVYLIVVWGRERSIVPTTCVCRIFGGCWSGRNDSGGRWLIHLIKPETYDTKDKRPAFSRRSRVLHPSLNQFCPPYKCCRFIYFHVSPSRKQVSIILLYCLVECCRI